MLLGDIDTNKFAVKKFEEWVARDITNTTRTGVEALDQSDETLWQMNWVRVEEPPHSSSIRTYDRKRLWFSVTVRDCTGL